MSHLQYLRNSLTKVAKKEDKPHMEKYMRNQFTFFGVRAPVVQSIQKEFIKQFPLSSWNELKALAEELYEQSERECQYIAIGLLHKYKKLWPKSALSLFKQMITTKSWWDTVDAIDTKLVGEYFLIYPDKKVETMNTWIQSKNVWLQRSALQFQLNYKTQTDWNLLSSLCSKVSMSEEFFIHTAIGWSLRQYSKVNKQHVQEFVDKTPLKPRARKEALIFIQGKTS